MHGKNGKVGILFGSADGEQIGLKVFLIYLIVIFPDFGPSDVVLVKYLHPIRVILWHCDWGRVLKLSAPRHDVRHGCP